MFWDSILTKLFMKARRHGGKHRRLGLDILEDRLAPANFSQSGAVIRLTFNTANEALQIHASSAHHYELSSSANFIGSVNSPSSFSGFNTTNGTLITSGVTQINIVDAAQVGALVTFTDSAADYAEIIAVTLTNAGAGPIQFNGTSTFNGDMSAFTANSITFNADSTVTMNGTGNVQATGASTAVNFNGNLTVNSIALKVKAGQNIGEGVDAVLKTASATDASFTLTGGLGDVVLDSRFNDFAGHATFSQSSPGKIRDVNFRNINPSAQLPSINNLTLRNYTLTFDNTNIVLPVGLSVTGALVISAGSGIAETGAISAGGPGIFAVLTNGSIVLNSPNNIPSVAFSCSTSDNTTAVTYTGASNFDLGASDLGLGVFTVAAPFGSITQSGPVTQKRGAGAATFAVAGQALNLPNADNDFEGSIIVTALPNVFGTVNTVILSNSSTLAAFPTLPDSVIQLTLTATNAPVVLPNRSFFNLTVNAQGFFQAPGSAVVVSNQTDLTAPNNPIVLFNDNNDFNEIRLNNSGPNRVAIKDVNSISFNSGAGNSILGSGAFTVTAGGAIGEINSSITQDANAGRTTFIAGPGFAINLPQNNVFCGPVIFNTSGAGGNVNLVDVSKPLTLGTSNIGGNLNIIADADTPISQDPGSTLTLGGSTVINTSAVAVALDNSGNHFTGSIGVQAGNVRIRNSGPVDLGATNVSGGLTVHAGGAITQSGPIDGDGVPMLFDAGTAPITLTDATNRLGIVTAISTGAAAVKFTDVNTLDIDGLTLGSGPLTLDAVNIHQDQFTTGRITQITSQPLTFSAHGGSVLIDGKNNRFLGSVALPNGAKGLDLFTTGDLSFIGTPAITGALNLDAGANLSLPAEPLTLDRFNIEGTRVVVHQNLTTTQGMQFFGAIQFAAGLTLASGGDVLIGGDVNPAGALTFNLGATAELNFSGGTWQQGTNTLTINGGDMFLIEGGGPTTFNMVSGAIVMPGSADIVVGRLATFKVGGTAAAETVTVDNNAGTITFNNGSTLSVGLGSTNDKLVKAQGDIGNIIIESGAKLTSYAGLAGAALTPLLAASAGVIDTTAGFFDRTVDTQNGNAGRAFLMGTDIVQPNYSATQLTIASGGTLFTGGIVSGFEFDSDKFTIQAVKTGTSTGVPLVFNVNVAGLIEIVIRNAAVPTTLTVTTTKNFGDGFTHLGGIAVNGPGTAMINAPKSGVFGDILVAGPLAALSVRDFGLQPRSVVLCAGGTSSGATTITGRSFANIIIDLPTVLTSWTLNQLTISAGGHNVISAERFGTIKCTPNVAENLRGDFDVDSLINLNRANSTLPAIGSVTVGGTLGNNSGTSALSVWDIAGDIGSVTAAATDHWQLGAAGGANVQSGDKLRNVGVLNLGRAFQSNLHALGKISTLTATNWRFGNLQAGVFGTIKIAGNGVSGNLGEFKDITLTATSNSGLSTVTGVPGFEALASLSMAGDSSNVTLHLLDGNATSIVAARGASQWTVTADATTHGGSIAKLVAGAWDVLTLDAKNAGTIAAVGNVAGNVFGDFNGEITLHGTPGFTGVTLGALNVSRNMSDSSVLVENGSIGTIAVAHSMTDANIRAVGAAGAVTSITAGEWVSPLRSVDNLVARNIGTLKITGAPLTAPGGFLAGDFRGVNVLAFRNGGINPAIGTLSIAGNYLFVPFVGGFLRADNGVTTFQVGRSLGGDGGRGDIALLNSSALSDVPGRIANLTVGKWGGVNLAAKTLGTVKAIGFATPESPGLGFNPGSITGCNITLFGATNVPLTPHVSLDSLTANEFSNASLLAPFGITLATADFVFGTTINTDNPPAGTAGRIGTFQAVFFENDHVRAVSIGTLRSVNSNNLLSEFRNSDVTVTGFTGPTTSPVAIGMISIQGGMRGSTFNVPHSITSFAIGGAGSNEIAAGFAANSGITTLSVGDLGFTTVTSRSIGAFSVANSVSTGLITLTGNRAGVALGSFTARGRVAGSTFNITGGSVTSFITGAFFGSHLVVGFHMPRAGDIFSVPSNSDWLLGNSFTLGTFKTTGIFDPTNIAATASFRDSYVVAQHLGVVAIAGLDPDVPAISTSFRFGIAFRASVGSGPIIKVNGVNESVGFAEGDFAYVDLDG